MNIDAVIGSVSERIAPISRQIWDAKYRLKTADGTPVDLTIEDTWRRVARALAAGESDRPGGSSHFTTLCRISASCPPAGSCPAPAQTGA
jgi:ribonucleoside-diphosphate reductase alpha chain